MGLLKSIALSALVATSVMAEYDPNKKQCGMGIGDCPESAPCCSAYGQCGLGAYCLSGCDPRNSFSVDSCVPAPVCQSKTHTFKNLERCAKIQDFLGDPEQADWMYQGQPTVYQNNLVLTMPRNSVGTVMTSTVAIWYGKVTAKLRTSRGAGVVTAFILMSDVKDEIDYEWVGTELGTTQTNFYFEGITNYQNSQNISTSDTFSNWHTYEVDWTPDSITWSVDGKVGRVKKKSDTWNSTSKSYNYPQTPSHVQLSLWPGGLASNGKGTIDWAGGPITWSGPDIEKNGYYYAMVESVDIQCYDPPKGAQIKGKTAYKYTSKTNPVESSVAITNDNTVLKSFLGSGTDMDKAPKSVNPTATGTAAIPEASNVETIPGMTGAGFGSNDNGGHPGDPGSGAASGGSSGGGSTNGNSDTNGFSQGGSNKNDASTVQGGRSSMLAVFIAIIALGFL